MKKNRDQQDHFLQDVLTEVPMLQLSLAMHWGGGCRRSKREVDRAKPGRENEKKCTYDDLHFVIEVVVEDKGVGNAHALRLHRV